MENWKSVRCLQEEDRVIHVLDLGRLDTLVDIHGLDRSRILQKELDLVEESLTVDHQCPQEDGILEVEKSRKKVIVLECLV